MPQAAVYEIKVKAGKEELSDKVELQVGGYVAVTDEAVCPNGTVTIDLFAGPSKQIDVIMIKSDIYRRKEDAASKCSMGEQPQISAKFCCDAPDKNSCEFKLSRALFLSAECVSALLPDNIESVTITNPLPLDIKVSVIVVRKMKTPMNGAGINGVPMPEELIPSTVMPGRTARR